MINNVFGVTFDQITDKDHENWSKVEKFYFGANNLDVNFDTHFDNLTDLMSDVGFLHGTDITAR